MSEHSYGSAIAHIDKLVSKLNVSFFSDFNYFSNVMTPGFHLKMENVELKMILFLIYIFNFS